MLEQFLRRVCAAVGRSGAEDAHLWDWLESHPRLARADVRQLRAWYESAAQNRRVPLMRLHNLIVRTERQLAQ
jgi:transposase